VEFMCPHNGQKTVFVLDTILSPTILLGMSLGMGNKLNEGARINGVSNQPRMGRSTFIVMTSITVAIGGFLFGYDTAVISGAILFVRSQFHLTSVQTEIAVSIVLAGALMGTAFGGYLGDRFGRRPTLLMTAITYGVFALTTGFANEPWLFVVSRLFVGVAVGPRLFVVPLLP